MHLLDLLTPARVRTDAIVSGKKRLLERLAGLLAEGAGGEDERAVFDAISRGKDVDGVTANAFLDMANGQEGTFAACTPAGIVALLDAYEVLLDKAASARGR